MSPPLGHRERNTTQGYDTKIVATGVETTAAGCSLTSGATRLIWSVAMAADALATHSGVGGAVALNWMPEMRSRSRT